MDEIRAGVTAPLAFPGERICHPVSGFILGCIDAEMFKVSFLNYHNTCKVKYILYCLNLISTELSDSSAKYRMFATAIICKKLFHTAPIF